MKEQAIAGNPQAEEIKEEGVMTLGEHIGELRKRLFKVVIAVAATTLLTFLFIQQIMAGLLELAGPNHLPLALRPTEMFVTYMQVAFICGLALALPFVLYQLLAFLAPGLRPVEKRYIFLAVPFMTIAFICGVAFGYLIVIPRALNFLLGFGSDLADVRPSVEYLIGFISKFLFALGAVFETPLLIFFLTKIGIVSRERLAKYRKYAFLVICVIAAIITPTPDPVNMMIVAIPMYFLYEFGLILARFA